MVRLKPTIIVYLICIVICAGVGCGGKNATTPTPAMPLSHENVVLVRTRVLGPGPAIVSFKKKAIVRSIRIKRFAKPMTVGDVAALDGKPFGPMGWSYQGKGLDPSCESLTWTFANTIPNATYTWDPDPPDTTLNGTENVTINIQSNTAIGQYSETIAGHCTNPSHTGIGPGGSTFVVGVVTLDIVDIPQDQSAGSVITNVTTNKVAGQFIDFFASPQPSNALHAISWSIPNDPISSYTYGLQAASKTDLQPTDRQSPHVEFYWFKPNASPDVVGLQAAFPTNWGDPWGNVYVSGNVSVIEPTATMASTTGSVLVSVAPQAECVWALTFGIANQGSDCDNSNPVGIQWTFIASAPPAAAGKIDATQLIDVVDTSPVPEPGAPVVPTAYPTTAGYVLDTCTRYGPDVNVPSNGSATWSSNDSPGYPLQTGWSQMTGQDKFITYFVYKPNDKGSPPAGRHNIWVALGKMTWDFHGTATGIYPTPPPSPVIPSPSPLPTATPTWTKASGSGGVNNTYPSPQPLPTWSNYFRTLTPTCPP